MWSAMADPTGPDFPATPVSSRVMDSSRPLQALPEDAGKRIQTLGAESWPSDPPARGSVRLGGLFDAGSMTGLSDRDLIERFSGPRDRAAEAAFEALVTRHGPMVHRVCRNVLPNPDDAEDAFQATFLVLVRQRGSIRKLDSVASWLYGVAARVAARARVDAARRRKTEDRKIRLAPDSVSSTESAERSSNTRPTARSSRKRSASFPRSTGPSSCSASGRA